jgi:acetyl-CoA carboxylase carboxyltransferase component
VRAEQGDAAHDALLAELTAQWTHESEPWESAAHVHLDDVIDPRRTRDVIARAIDIAWGAGRRPPTER